MTLLFSEYLVQKKQMPQERIVDALVEQLRTIPAVAEVIYEKEILSKSDLYKILCYQQTNKLDFRQSAQELGLWSKDVSEKALQQIERVRKPLGEILIEKGFLSLEDLTSSFVAYVEEMKQTTEPKAPSAQLDSTLLNEYTQSLELSSLPAIETGIISLEQLLSSLEPPNIIHDQFLILVKSILVEYIGIRARLHFIGAKQTEKLVDSTIQFLEVCSTTNMPIEMNCVVQVLKSSSRILLSTSQYLKNFKNEAG